MDLNEVDRKLSEISKEINFYSFLTPLNGEEEKDKFFSSLRKEEAYNPVFSYKERGLGDKKSELNSMRSLLDEKKELHRLFIRKIDFVIRSLELLEADDTGFGDIARNLHGVPNAECLKFAKNILVETKKEAYAFPEEEVTPDEMASILRKVLEDKGIDWKCVISGKIVPKITVSGENKTVYVNSRINYTREEVERLKVHEVEVHIYRGANGARQPYRVFAEGLADYDETEEGLAIVAEEITGSLKLDRRQMKLYAGRAFCVDLCMGGTFYETFMALREFFPDYLAYRLTERGKRGLKDTSNKGGLTKGFHYISGFLKMREYIREGGDLKVLYVGKIGIEDVGSVRHLLSEGILSPPEYLPDFI